MSLISQASEQMELGDVAAALLRAEMSPPQALRALLDAGETADAIKLAARLLPKRHAVAWLCVCARDQPLALEDKAGASLAEKWVREPSEENRRAAFEFAHAGGYRSLGAWFAAAAGWSGGSLAPAAQQTPVPPAEHLTAKAAAAAATLLAVREPEDFVARRAAYAERAFDMLQASFAAGERS